MKHLLGLVACLVFFASALGQDKVASPSEPFFKDGQLVELWRKDLQQRRDHANLETLKAGKAALKDADAWRRFTQPRIQALATSLGESSATKEPVKVVVTKKIVGEGYHVENLVYESRPGIVVTANLYVPANPKGPMPALVILHSHHNPKTEGELQDMGSLWARQGCLVLVPDLLGHGERRQHPFKNAKSFPEPFKTSRQDYWFRYDLGLQLTLVGESLIGWFAHDIRRGIDLLLERPGIAKDKIVVLGAVAGGGDPAAVVAALDARVAGVVPFNFGGPQPETKFPLPKDADLAFNYMGGGSWESTRNLRGSAKHGFLPWVIVASVAPRKVLHAHEFAWDRDRDPAWRLYGSAFDLFGDRKGLAFTYGRGSVRGSAPESTHCNNIGAEHRKAIHPAFEAWFGIPQPMPERMSRLSSEDLQCLTDEARTQFQAKSVAEVLAARVDARLTKVREKETSNSWAEVVKQTLGFESLGQPVTIVHLKDVKGAWRMEVVKSAKDEFAMVPLYWALPTKVGPKTPVVVALAQGGRLGFLKHRSAALAEMTKKGIAVAIPELRGIGEAQAGKDRGRGSSATSLSSTEQMFGRTVPGVQLAELDLVLRRIRAEHGTVGLWGDSFAEVNPDDVRLDMPHDASKRPSLSEPAGPNLALFAAASLPANQVRGVLCNGGLFDYRSLLSTSFIYVPHDAVVPGMLAKFDLPDLVRSLKQTPTRMAGMVDEGNRRVGDDRVAKSYPWLKQPETGRRSLSVQAEPITDAQLAIWWTEVLRP